MNVPPVTRKNLNRIPYLISIEIIWLKHETHGIRNWPAKDNSYKGNTKSKYRMDSYPLKVEYYSASS